MSEIQKFDEYKSQITHILTTMFDYLSLEGTFTVEERGQKIGVKIASEDAGRIIGRKGQTLDSLQLILNRILFKQDEECPHVMLDIDGYANGERDRRSNGEDGAPRGDRQRRPRRDRLPRDGGMRAQGDAHARQNHAKFFCLHKRDSSLMIADIISKTGRPVLYIQTKNM